MSVDVEGHLLLEILHLWKFRNVYNGYIISATSDLPWYSLHGPVWTLLLPAAM